MRFYFLLTAFIALLWTCPLSLQAQEKEPTEEKKSIEVLKQELELLKQQAETYKPGTSRFLIRGYAHSGLQAANETVTFDGGSLNPLFLYKQSDRLLFEAELDIQVEGAATSVGLEYANISYILNKDLMIRVGQILTPFGIFVPNLHPAWINKLPSVPLGAGHGGILPSNDIGVELRGASYLGPLKVSYSAYVVNGPRLNTGEEEPEEAGQLHYGEFPDNNKGKTIGGRLGVFPLSNSSLELGISGMYGKVGDKDSEFKDVKARHYAFDLSFVQRISALSSVLDAKAQYSVVNVDRIGYPDHENPSELVYFDNTSSNFFGQLSIRPALLSNKFFRNLEFVGRYSFLKTPQGAEWEVNQDRWDVGVNYWVDWRTVLKFSYRINGKVSGVPTGLGEEGHGESDTANVFFIHWAIGF